MVGRVTPLAGVWIEISYRGYKKFKENVTPLAGVWIEMKRRKRNGKIL